MIRVLILFFFSLSLHLKAQDFSVWKGIVKDKTTGLPIAFVNVSTDKYHTMVVTNDEGAFRIVVEKGYAGSLTFEHIGYQKYVLPHVNQATQPLHIYLEANVHQLKTVNLQTQTGEDIIKKVIKNLDKNYNSPSKSFEVFHRGDYTISDWAKNTLCSQMKVEQVLHIQYPAKQEKNSVVKEQLIKVRFIDNMHPIEINVISSNARILSNLNLAYFQRIDILEEKNTRKYNFTIDSTETVQEGFISLHFKSKKYGKIENETVEGSMIIDESNFSIASISFIKRRRDKVKEEGEVNYKYNNTKITINYTKIEGSYYPTYIRSDIYETNEFSENNETVDGLSDKWVSEIFITKQIEKQAQEIDIKKEEERRLFKSFFNENQESDDTFFQAYNVIYAPKESNIETEQVLDNEVVRILAKTSRGLEHIKNGSYNLIHTKTSKENTLKLNTDSLFVIFEKKKYGSYSANIFVQKKSDKFTYLNNAGLFELDSVRKTYKHYAPSSIECLFFSRQGLVFPALPKSIVYFDNLIHAVKVCKTNFRKEKIHNEDVYVIEVHYPNSKDRGITDFKEMIYIKEKDYMPIKIVIQKQEFGKWVSENWIISNITFDADNQNRLKMPENFNKGYKKEN